jgi:hypothetical protein
VWPRCSRHQTRNSPTPISGAINHTRHGEPAVRLSLTDDVFLRSFNWARWQPRIALPVN